MLEARRQAAILRYLRNQPECFAFKADVSARGIPDIICCYRGRFIAFEVKGRDEKPTAIQVAQMHRVEVAGGRSYVVETVEQVTRILEKENSNV